MRSTSVFGLSALIILSLSFTTPAFASSPCWKLLVKKVAGLRGPNEYWRQMPQLARDSHGKYVLYNQKVEFWTREGNPVLRFNPADESVRFRPSQGTLPNWREDHFFVNGVTQFTISDPIYAMTYWSPDEGLLNLIIMDGHHRFAFAQRVHKDVYIEIGAVTEPQDWHAKQGQWLQSPLF